MGKCQIRHFCQQYTASATVEMTRAIGRMESSIMELEERLVEQNTAEQRRNVAELGRSLGSILQKRAC